MEGWLSVVRRTSSATAGASGRGVAQEEDIGVVIGGLGGSPDQIDDRQFGGACAVRVKGVQTVVFQRNVGSRHGRLPCLAVEREAGQRAEPSGYFPEGAGFFRMAFRTEEPLHEINAERVSTGRRW